MLDSRGGDGGTVVDGVGADDSASGWSESTSAEDPLVNTMRIFVGFGYLRHELWVKQMVLPMLRHLGLHVISGEEIPGRPIDRVIRQRIESCDAMIGLLLRRGRWRLGGFYETSEYVRQELEIALGLEKPVIQIVERNTTSVRAKVLWGHSLDSRRNGTHTRQRAHNQQMVHR